MEAKSILIIGSVLSVLLTINGFFIREMVKSIYEIRLRVEVLITKHDNIEKVADKNTIDIAGLNNRMHKIEAVHLQNHKI